jgi:hypothetical protein
MNGRSLGSQISLLRGSTVFVNGIPQTLQNLVRLFVKSCFARIVALGAGMCA